MTRVDGRVLIDYEYPGVTRLTIEPVSWATEDGTGGVVFETVTEEPGVVWLRAGADHPVKVDLGDSELQHLPVEIEGKPSVVVARSSDEGTTVPAW